MTTTTTVPAGLAYDPTADPQRGRHLLLGAPWGARVHPLHESGADRISKDDFTVDRALLEAGLEVTVNHDPRRKVGRIVDAATDDVGLWIVADLTGEGERVLRRDGRVSIDVIQPKFRWLLSGVALLTPDSEAGIDGARAIFTADGERRYWVEATSPSDWPAWHHKPWLSTVAREADRSGGVVVRNGAKPPTPVPYVHHDAVDLAEHTRELRAYSMQAVHDDTEYRRRQFDRRQAALAEMRRDDELRPYREGMVPHSQWPVWSKERQSYDALVARQASERAERARVAQEAENAAVRELQASWRAREATTVVAVKERTSWIRRMTGKVLRHRWTSGH